MTKDINDFARRVNILCYLKTPTIEEVREICKDILKCEEAIAVLASKRLLEAIWKVEDDGERSKLLNTFCEMDTIDGFDKVMECLDSTTIEEDGCKKRVVVKDTKR